MTDEYVQQWNPVCKVGDDWVRYVQVLDEDGVAVTDYTGWSFFMGIKESPDSTAYLFQLALAAGITVVDIDGAKFIRLHLTRAQSGTVTVDKTPRPGGNFPEKKGVCDFVAQDADGLQVTALEGPFTFRARVTA
ncbi:MAG: hypothetical protein ACK4NR_09140 [Micavibrio sp.]